MSPTFRRAIFLQFIGTIGSGIFVLPYLFYHSNYLFASIVLIFLTVVVGALNQFYCRIVSCTPGDHQLSGYAQIYLGSFFSFLASFNLILLAFGAVATYLKLFSGFFSLLFPVSFSLASFLFFILLFVFFIAKINFSSRLSSVLSFLTILIPLVLFIFSVSFIGHSSSLINQAPDFSFYGAALFALSGFTIIPEIDELLRRGRHRQQESLFAASTLGLILVVIIYLIFIYSVIVISGPSVSVNTISGLIKVFPILGKLIAVFGLVVTFNAALQFLTILHELFFRDLKFSPFVSSFLPLTVPFLSLFLGAVSLVSLISLTGSVTLFISALIIILIRLRLPRTFWSDFFAILVLICLIFGLIVDLIY